MAAKEKLPYRKVSALMWLDQEFRSLSDDSKLLWVYFLTSHEAKIPGVIVGGKGHLSDVMGWTPERLAKGFRELLTKGWAKPCWEAGLVWLPKAFEFNPPENPNQLKGWSKAWMWIPECPLKSEISQALKPFCERFGEPFAERFPEPYRKPMSNEAMSNEAINKTIAHPEAARPSIPRSEVTAAELEAVYQLYPRKKGKAPGLKKAARLIRTRAEFLKFEQCVQFMAKAWASADLEFCPYFSTFVSEQRWQDETPPTPAAKPGFSSAPAQSNLYPIASKVGS